MFAVTAGLNSGTTLLATPLLATGAWVAGQPLRQEEAKTMFATVLATAEVVVRTPGRFLTDLP